MKKANKGLRVANAALIIAAPLLVASTIWTNNYKSLVCAAIGGTTSKVVNTGKEEDTEYFKSNGLSLNNWLKEEEKIIKEVQSEGSVLLKNDNNALPLAKGAKVSAFGYGTINSISTGMVKYGSPGPYTDFKTGIEKEGKITINPTLYNFYKENSTAKLDFNTLNEIDVSKISSDVKSSYTSYNDAAIVMISRAGGEGGDLATGDFKGGKKYLALQESEKKMLKEAKDNFSKVIVLLNTSYAMELDWLDEYGVDACLMIGAVGYSSFEAIADILVGDVNPSGRTVDTFAADSFSSPAIQNFGDYTFTNSEQIDAQIGKTNNGTKYVVEKEGIYVGYKYYETRYEDSVLNQGNANSAKGAYKASTWKYENEVVFPFGHGLSYTSWDEELINVNEKEDSFELSVKVTNTGNKKGKRTIQIYAQTPYTDFDKQNNIEVSSIQLVGFDKTEELQPQESKTYKITVDKEDLTHYDSYVNKTYIYEAGDYYFTVAIDAHSATNNVLKMKGKEVDGDLTQVKKVTKSNTDTETYSVSDTNVIITNRFDDADLNYWIKDSVTYLSRSDWEKTWPTTVTELTATQQMIDALNADGHYEAGPNDFSDITLEKDTDINVATLMGASFDDEHWQELIDSMSVEEIFTLVSRSGLVEVPGIGYPSTFMKDGSHRVADRTYVEDPSKAPIIFPSAVIMAQTYNEDIMLKIGQTYGEDNIRTKTVGHYAPAVNIHRTPYSGRNFEYFSEDGFLSGRMSVNSIKGMQEKGAIPYLKHFAFNDQETNRQGISTFMNQQAMREVYLEGFKAGVEEGKVKGIMGGFNRIGCSWTGGSKGLNVNVLREEWGFTGILDTDAVFSYNPFMSIKVGLENGVTMWATSGTGVYDKIIDFAKQDSKIVKNAKKAAHYLLYNVVNSLAFNGISSSSKIVPVKPWWQSVLFTIDGVVGALLLASIGATIYLETSKKKEGTN